MLYLPPDNARLTPAIPADRRRIDWSARFAQLARVSRDVRLRAYYEAGAVAADTPLAEVPMVALDFETTGFDPARDGIVSIGLVPFRLARIQSSAARHWVVRPRSLLTEQSVVIHRITHAEINRAPDLNAVLAELLQLLAGRVVVVHHRGIERAFLDAALRVRLGEGIEFPVIDTMELEARLHRRGQRWWRRLLGRTPPSIRLGDSRRRYRLPFYHPHNATIDALATAELLLAQVAHRFEPDSPVADLWC